MTLALHYALRSDVGLLREGNEDSAFAGPRLLAIADGMGGHAAGEVASAVAISAIAPLDRRGLTDEDEMLGALAAAVLSARSTLHDMSMADPATEGMGTTLTAMLWAGDQVAICHIGDSRAYLLRDKNLYQITRDHTLIQSLVDEGRLSPAAAATHPQRSLIMRALQGSTDADPDLAMHQAFLGDRYLLCSDGLTDVVTDEVVAETLLKYRDADEAVGVLIDQAINNGGPGNITCIVADVVDTVTGPVPPSREQQVAGAAANPDARSMLRDKSAPAASKAATTGPQASVNGHRVRTTVDDDELTGMMPRRRRRWPIVTSVLAVLAVLVIGGLFVGWRITQGQYYVASDGSHVIIYRGVSDQIAGLHLSSVYQRTTIPAKAVPADLQLPTTPGSLTKARQTVTTIQDTYNCQLASRAVAHWNSVEAAWVKAKAAWTKKYGHAKKGTRVPAPPAAPKAAKPAMPSYCAALGAG